MIFLKNLILILIASNLQAQNTPGTTSASYLKILTGARPSAMGEAFSAVSDDINATEYNPAGLTQIKNNQLLLSHVKWFEGINKNTLAYLHHYKKISIGLTFNYLQTDSMVERNMYGEDIGKFNFSSLETKIALSYKLDKNLSIGTSLKNLIEKLYSKKGIGYGFDIGILYTSKNIKFAIISQNIGTKIKLYESKFSLPHVIKFGAAYQLTKNILISMDYSQFSDRTDIISVGSEYEINKNLFMRGGYKVKNGFNNSSGISAGAGIKINKLNIDYAITTEENLETVQRISFIINFKNKTNNLK